ncbi:hypothetical protein GYMLUDRAFT_43169 [Collybiopsis luxurians FD-317 M1]|uniref:Unplaced genomic scaffold GYMLUscaffold_24, whole genome shotgun sequence n=1 Tax=Collybiopsis luxurians FD-317 M1 TaxID=944289 RepID=A0A0D0CQ21_9AGAR|nr:hypothetical protein GYMLUDRAFT_43169 [Collybiopsis luxurians FD-317 M1]
MLTTSTTNSTEEGGSLTNEWRISFETVSWAYSSPNSSKARSKALCRPLLHSSAVRGHADGNSSSDSELELRSDLVGVEAAGNVLGLYEECSGFHHKFVGLDLTEKDVPDISRHIGDRDVAVSREMWDEMMQNLTGDFTEDLLEDSSSGSDSSSLASSLVLDWEVPAHVSMPSTPKPQSTSSFVISRSCNISPWPSPPSKLNASASAFTPSRTSVSSLGLNSSSSATKQSSPSPPLSELTFPSLNPLPSKPPSYLKLKIEKDDQGFFTNIEEEAEEMTPKSRLHPSSTLLPAFLQPDDQTRRKGSSSKTRSLVDRLRSRKSSSRSRDGSGYSPSPSPVDPTFLEPRAKASDDESDSSLSRSVSQISIPRSLTDQDGWIGIDNPSPPSSSTSQERRDIVLSLSSPMPRRTEPGLVAVEPEEGNLSSPSSQEASLSASSSSSSFPSTPSTPPTPSASMVTTNDGWIEVSEAKSIKKSSSADPSKKPPAVKADPDILMFPTLNAPPPSPSNHRTSRTRSRTRSTANSSRTASKTANARGSVPTTTATSYLGAYPSAVSMPVSYGVGMPYLPPIMPGPFAVVGVGMSPQYGQYPPSLYHQPRQPQHTHTLSHPHLQYQHYLNQHQRAHSVSVPASLAASAPIPNGYVPAPPSQILLQGWR